MQPDPRDISLDQRSWTEDNDQTKSGNTFNQNHICSKSGFIIPGSDQQGLSYAYGRQCICIEMRHSLNILHVW